ncbi:MAG: carboxypeptidase regulatory-like domain-containing protein [Candidatus Taylorbacteria bacterium]|nr:carboxypeptidase regulatory-like domain-containing protein [Candidatus Taylorbacteria bacterium]
MTIDERNVRFTKIYLTMWGVCVFVALSFFVLYKFGFRLTNKFEPVKVATIELKSNQSDLQIFLDNRELKASFQDGRYIIKNVIPGLHSVLVSKNGFWPWTKIVNVTENNSKSIYAFIFPTEGATAKKISPETSEYKIASKGLKSSILPEPASYVSNPTNDESITEWLKTNVPNFGLSLDKSTALYIMNNTIYVAWISSSEPPPHYFCEENPCKLIMPVTISTLPIQSVVFYKDRRDVVLFSAGSNIYGIELDRQGTQNFQPLLKVNNPYFYQAVNGQLYIKDGNSIFSVSEKV